MPAFGRRTPGVRLAAPVRSRRARAVGGLAAHGGHLLRVDEPVAPPAHSEQPSSGADDGVVPRPRPLPSRSAPAVEAAPGGARVERRADAHSLLGPVTSALQKHIAERVTDGTGAGERAGMVAVGKDAARSAHRAIDRAREANRKAL